MTEYIEPEDVDDWVARHGFHYRDRGLMLSALHAPMPVFGQDVHVGLAQKAAALLLAFNRDHPLMDGNKRLSWLVTAAFCELNELELRVDPAEGERFVLLVADGKLDLIEIAGWIRDHLVPGPALDRANAQLDAGQGIRATRGDRAR